MSVQIDLAGGPLGPGVGGHDAPGRLGPMMLGGVRQGRGQGIDNLGHRQRFANDPGGKRQHLVGADARMLRQRLAAGLGVFHAPLAGAGVGVTGIDHQVARSLFGQVTATEDHRGGAELVAGENTGHPALRGQFEHHQVLATGLFDSGAGNTQLDARDREKFGQGSGTYRHPVSPLKTPVTGGAKRKNPQPAAAGCGSLNSWQCR